MLKNTKEIKSSAKNVEVGPIDIIIPCAGLAYRMKSISAKSLLKIDKEYLINYQIKILRNKFKDAHIIVVGGHEYNKIYDVIPNDVCFVKNSNFETTNVIKSIYDGIQACVHDRVLIVYGDLVFPSKYFNDYLPVKSNIIVNTCNSMSDEEIGCTYNSNKLEYLMYGLTPKWSQIMFLANKELELAYNFCKNEQNHNKLGFEMINHIVDNKGTIEAHQNGHKIIDIDYIKDINKIKGII